MKIITGTYMRPDGTPAAGATLRLLLSQDAIAFGYGILIHEEINITLDQAGSIPAATQIYANDEIQPAGTYYGVTVKDPAFGRIYFEHLVIAGTSPINLDNIAPALK